MISFLTFFFLIFSSHWARAGHNGKVLLIGDSHSVMEFGVTLAGEFKPKAQLYAVSGSASNDWLTPSLCPDVAKCPFDYGYATPAGAFQGPLPSSFPGLTTAIQLTKATAVIIALGTNDVSQRCLLGHPADMQPFKDLIAQVGARKCIWIGPPIYNRGPVFDSCGGRYDDFVEDLRATVEAEGCEFVDSRQVIDPRTNKPIESNCGDEVHFCARLGRLWARSLAPIIRKLLSENYAQK